MRLNIPKDYIRFTEVSAFFMFSTHLLSPVLSPYIKGMGFSDFQLGLIFSFLPLSMIIFSPVIGKLSDITSRRTVIVMGIGMEILALIFYIIGNSVFLVSFARMLDAIAVVTVILISLAKVEDVVDSKKRGEYTGLTETFNYAGRLAAPLIGGIIADDFFIKAPFFVSLVLTSVLFLFLFKKEKIPKFAKKKLNPFKEIKEFLSHKKLRGMAILGIVMHAASPSIDLFLPLFIIYELGLSVSFVGYAMFFMGLSHILQFWFGKISDKYGSWKIVLLGCVIAALGLGMVSFTNSFILLVIFLFVRGTGGAMWNTSAWSLMSDVGEKQKEEGGVVTSYMSVAKIGAFISFILSGLVVTYFGIQTLFLINSVVILIGVALSYGFLKK